MACKNRLVIVFGLGSALTACANGMSPNFNSMSDEEIAAYNATVPPHEQVVCNERVEIGSIIRRRICLTREEDYENKRNDMEILRTVNSGPVNVDLQ